METLRTSAIPAGGAAEIKRIGESDVKWALAQGWEDFKAKRGDLIFVGLLYPLVCFLVAAVVLNQQLLPLFFPLVAGLSIMGPAVASGFYELARRREEGRDASWSHFLDPLRDARRGALLSLAGGLAVLFVAWIVFAWIIYSATLGTLAPSGANSFFQQLFTTGQGWAMILIGNAVGFIFAVLTLVLSIASFPMAVDKVVDPGVALRTSFHAVSENPRAVISWGLRVALLLVLGSIPLFIGLAVVLPVLGYATWHLYTRMVAR